MPAWLSAVISFLASLLKAPFTHLAAYWAGKRAGEAEQENRQHEAGKKALKRGADAGNEYRRGGLRKHAERYHTDE